MEKTIHMVGKKNVCSSCIILLKAEANYSEIFLTDGKKIVISKTLKELEKKFSEFGFFRSHKSYLVNLEHIVSFSQFDSREILLTNNYKADVSRRRLPSFLEIRHTKNAL